ncbi:hypothetical protein FOZ63_002895 [Perkinsus olseni]|uniref:Peptidase A1 domain-containing protein n=1 Tax=Perkinsus olseni TaxID=32597 RepID=A0A7J6U2F3_PEROL|nr:hypothetical protein FOZ62_027500 [Perkinsus olseni]KAF4750997.1 hypothetical protein FOZ63_002895 [Perkinsus olseni]
MRLVLLAGGIVHLILAAVVDPSGGDRTVTLPIQDNHVKMTVDGLEMNLFLDSGTDKILVNDGVWYERKYGMRACEDPRAACFYCPGKAGCYPSDLPVFTADFLDGSVIKYVVHTSTVMLGGHVIKDAEFGVIVDFVPPANAHFKVPGTFGVARGYRTNPVESPLAQLRNRRVIGRESFSIRTESSEDGGINGRLTLGDAIQVGSGTQMIPLDTTWTRKVSVWVFSVALVNADGSLPRIFRSKRLGGDRSYVGYVVHGIKSLHIPHAEGLIDEIFDHAKRAMDPPSPGHRSEIKLGQRTKRGRWVLRKAVLEYLPTLAFRLGSDGSHVVKISPTDFTRCKGEKCTLRIVESKIEDRVVLGAPLIRAYDVSVNFGSNMIGLQPRYSQLTVAS